MCVCVHVYVCVQAKGGKAGANARRKVKAPVKIGGSAAAPKKIPTGRGGEIGSGGAGGGGQAGAAGSRARAVMLSDSDSSD